MDIEKELAELGPTVPRELTKAVKELIARERWLTREMDLLRARAAFYLQYGQAVDPKA